MSDGLIPAISIRQPWVWCTLHAGKRIENRSRAYKYRGPVLLHAAKALSSRDFAEWKTDIFGIWRDTPYAEAALRAIEFDLPEYGDLPRGGIVGRAVIVGCVHESEKHLLAASDKPWFTGPYGLVLDSVEPLPFRPCKGALSVPFYLPADLAEAA